MKITKPHGDLWIVFSKVCRQGFAVEVRKVKAHTEVHGDMSPEELDAVKGNDAADVGAKRAVVRREDRHLVADAGVSTRRVERLHLFLASCVHAVVQKEEGRALTSSQNPDSHVGHYSSVIRVATELWGDVPASHPLCAGDGLFAARFVMWFETRLWPASCHDDGVGISFVELAIAFVLETATPLPCWTRADGWHLDGRTPVINFRLVSAARVVQSVVKFCIESGSVSRELCVGSVSSLGAFGYHMNSGRSSGLLTRPAMEQRAVVASALRRVYHRHRSGSHHSASVIPDVVSSCLGPGLID